jgi:transposase
VHKYYDIKVEESEGIATRIEFVKKDIEEAKSGSGEYFLRSNYTLANETEIWDIYNTIREVESTFRCLKSDLRLRPVFHQKDQYTDAHIHLGLLAYQVVAPIRYQLKKNGFNYDWRNIVRIMNTQKSVTISMRNKDKEEIIIKSCSRPSQSVLEIYQSLKMKSMPYLRKIFVVHH